MKPRLTPGLLSVQRRLVVSRGEALQLLEVVDVVAGHGFDYGPERHRAALGVGGGAVAIFL